MPSKSEEDASSGLEEEGVWGDIGVIIGWAVYSREVGSQNGCSESPIAQDLIIDYG